MRDEFEKMLGAIKGTKFSNDERDVMRSRLRFFMNTHPAEAPFALRTLDSFSDGVSSMGSQLSFMHGFRFRSVGVAALALVLAVGVGTSYAAQDALPGDALYGIKINVNEPVQGSLATSPSAQADWNTELAQRRLAEAATLAAEGKLTPSAESSVAAGLDQATDNFDANVAVLSQSPGNVATIANAQSGMEATLDVDADVLDQLQSVVPASQSAITPLLARVRSRAIAISNAQGNSDMAVAASTGAGIESAAETKKDDAEGQLSAARTLAAQALSTSTPAASETFDAEQAIGAGDASLHAGQYGVALATYQSAVLDAQKAQLRLDLTTQLKQQTGISLPAATDTPAAVTSDSTTTSATSTQSAQPAEVDPGL
jgi:hypothetical protein